ncbi:hypothetical protein ACS0TY_008970 [Phlomoides rotata]
MDISKITDSKLFIVCAGQTVPYRPETFLYVIDLKLLTVTGGDGGDSDESVPLPIVPTVRLYWSTFNDPALCVLGSKLYIFQGQMHKEPYLDCKEVYTYELSDGASNLTLEKADVHKEGVGMNNPKYFPIAIVTEDGKILVFSSSFDVCSSQWQKRHFELYDPKTQICHNLPNLPEQPIIPQNCSSIDVRSYTFLKKNVFYLSTDDGGVFTLDLKRKPENCVWRRHRFYGGGDIARHRSLVVIDSDICLFPDSAVYIPPDGMDDYLFPSLPRCIPTHDFTYSAITLLNYKQIKDFSVCILQVGASDYVMDPERKYPELIIHAYHTQLPKCKKKLSENRKKKMEEEPSQLTRKIENFELPYTSKLTSFKFRVTEQFVMFSLLSFGKVCNCNRRSKRSRA